MRLDEFIQDHLEEILASWDDYAATLLPAARGMSRLELRNDVASILAAVCADMRTPQTARAQFDKSVGAGTRLSAAHTAAETHAILRAKSGYDIEQLVAEYRALRASVLRKFADAVAPNAHTLVEVGRFNEAIDQAVAESVKHFSIEVERSRNLFVGALGHDLRGPLNVILMCAQLLQQHAGEPRTADSTKKLLAGGERMRLLLDDLLDYNRSALGFGIPVQPRDDDLGAVCRDELSQLAASLPAATLTYEGPESLPAVVDASRIRQVIGNLVINASKYGQAGQPILLRLRSEGADALLEVENAGQPIDEATRSRMFEPMQRGEKLDPAWERSSLGLGLFIVRAIAQGHAGTATCTHADGRTLFTVRLGGCLRA